MENNYNIKDILEVYLGSLRRYVVFEAPNNNTPNVEKRVYTELLSYLTITRAESYSNGFLVESLTPPRSNLDIRVWNIRDYRDSYEKYLTDKEVSERERVLSCSRREEILASHLLIKKALIKRGKEAMANNNALVATIYEMPEMAIKFGTLS